MSTPEYQLEEAFIEKLRSLKYEYRPDIRDRAALQQNFRDKFEALNRVRLTDAEFARLLPDDLLRVHAFDWPVTFQSIVKAGGFGAVNSPRLGLTNSSKYCKKLLTNRLPCLTNFN